MLHCFLRPAIFYKGNVEVLCNFEDHSPFPAGSCASGRRHAVSEMKRTARKADQTENFATARGIANFFDAQSLTWASSTVLRPSVFPNSLTL